MDETEGGREARLNGHITVYRDGEMHEEERYCIMCGLEEAQCAFSVCDRNKCPSPGK